MSQAQLSKLLQQQLGYSLSVRPSNINHQEAGEGRCVCVGGGAIGIGAQAGYVRWLLPPGQVPRESSVAAVQHMPQVNTEPPFSSGPTLFCTQLLVCQMNLRQVAFHGDLLCDPAPVTGRLTQAPTLLALLLPVCACLCVCPCVHAAPTGLGLFVEGEVPPGALIALFPGLAYGKEVHRWGGGVSVSWH